MFKVGEVVKVKDGVKDPDWEDFDISGWQGKILDISETSKGRSIHIKWDNTTVNRMSDEVLERSMIEGLRHNEMELFENEVEPAESRSEEDLVERNIQPLLDEEKRVAKIIGDDSLEVNEETLEKYRAYLMENFDFPGLITGREDFPWEERYVFGYGDKAEYKKLKQTRPSYKDLFRLLDIVYEGNPDDGLIGKIKRIKDRKFFEMTLDYLESKDKKSKNYQLLEDYSFWFVNYR